MSRKLQPFPIWQLGDYGEPIEARFVDEEDQVVSLEEYEDSVVFLMTKPSGEETTFTASRISPYNAGIARYIVQPDDIDERGTWRWQARATGTAGRLTTRWMSFEVE